MNFKSKDCEGIGKLGSCVPHFLKPVLDHCEKIHGAAFQCAEKMSVIFISFSGPIVTLSELLIGGLQCISFTLHDSRERRRQDRDQIVVASNSDIKAGTNHRPVIIRWPVEGGDTR